LGDLSILPLLDLIRVYMYVKIDECGSERDFEGVKKG
jgi:hypothetical protein